MTYGEIHISHPPPRERFNKQGIYTWKVPFDNCSLKPSWAANLATSSCAN